MLPSFRNQSMGLLADQVTGFHIRKTLVVIFKGVKMVAKNVIVYFLLGRNWCWISRVVIFKRKKVFQMQVLIEPFHFLIVLSISVLSYINYFFNQLDDILQGRETEFLQTLHKLQKQPHFSIPQLETEIDKIKNCVAEVSWLLVITFIASD